MYEQAKLLWPAILQHLYEAHHSVSTVTLSHTREPQIACRPRPAGDTAPANPPRAPACATRTTMAQAVHDVRQREADGECMDLQLLTHCCAAFVMCAPLLYCSLHRARYLLRRRLLQHGEWRLCVRSKVLWRQLLHFSPALHRHYQDHRQLQDSVSAACDSAVQLMA